MQKFVSSLSMRRVKQKVLPDRFLRPPFTGLMLADYPDCTGSGIPHKHGAFQLIAVESGEFCFEAEKTFPAKSGDVLLFPPGLRHTWSVQKKGKAVQILLSPDFAERYCELRPLQCTDSRCVSIAPAQIRRTWNEIELEQKNREPGAALAITAVLLNLLVHVLREFSKDNEGITAATHEGIARVLLFLSRHYAEPRDLKGLAQLAGLSVSRFSALFRQHTGKSPVKYRIELRLGKAREMLFAGDRRIGEIALQCGFESVPYFHRQFQRVYGMTPHACRARR